MASLKGFLLFVGKKLKVDNFKLRLEQRPFLKKETCSNKRLLLEKLEFFEISHSSYQTFSFLPYLFTVYAVFYSYFFYLC